MLNKALQLIHDGVYDKIIFIRPNLGVKDVPELGYLKGSLYEKTSWLLSCFWDKVPYGEQGVQSMIDEDKLELVPLSFIRGRTFDNSIVYCCEFQNATLEICSLVLGRVGENSEIWFNGDSHQCDSNKFDKDNGILQLVDIFHDDRDFATVYMPKSERSKVARKCEIIDDWKAARHD